MAHRAWLSTLLHSRRAQLLLVNSLTFGLEVCLAAGITYVPPLLLEVGVEEKFMTMVLGRQFPSHLQETYLPFKGQIRAWRGGCRMAVTSRAALCLEGRALTQ